MIRFRLSMLLLICLCAVALGWAQGTTSRVVSCGMRSSSPCYDLNSMGKVAILKKTAAIRIGKEPVVLVPLKLWRQVEGYLEDQEALASKRFVRRIARSRREAAAGRLVYPFR